MLKWLGGTRAKDETPPASRPEVATAPAADPDELMRRAFPMHEAGNVAGAERLYRQILEIAPAYADAHYLLGRIAQDRGQIDAAIRHVREAVRHNSREASFHKTLGELHFGLGHFDEAMVYLGNAATLQPDDHEIWNNLACACENLGLAAEAAAHFARAKEAKENSPRGLSQLAQWLRDRGRADEALPVVDRMRRLTPDDPVLFSGYLYHLNLCSGISKERCFEEHLAFDAAFGTGRFGHATRPAADPDPDRRLRIGYFSPDFRSHPVACFLEGLFPQHDHQAFEVFCYFLHPYGDGSTGRFRKQADHWIECRGMSDAQIAERISADRIDLLIDLAGHTGGSRPVVLGRKPAPVIVTWLGYPNTTGLRTVDYRITDAVCDPEGMTDRFHTEALVRLPHQWCFSQPYAPADVTPLPAARNGRVRFGSFNNAAKMNEAMTARWAEILHQVPDSVLLVWGIEEEHAATIREIFRDKGVAPQRLEFSRRSPLPKQLLLYQDIDIALDTYPYSGVTTTFNSLWMGVPVVTLAGDTSASRSTHAILTGLGLGDWSAASAEQYVELAVRKAHDITVLASLRAGLREALLASPFMDAPGFMRQLEAAYRSVWRKHCATVRTPS